MPLLLSQLEPSTQFVGRTAELADVLRLLNDPQCRLLTLVGVGGVGKTRLAIQAIERLQAPAADQRHLISLQPVHNSSQLVTAIADALDVTMSGVTSPEQQLLDYLKPRTMLLLLDNFEHLLPAGEFLARIVQQVPNMKLVVTSREALSLREEWLYRVEGLSVPHSHQTQDLESYDALQLFVQRAKQVRTGFQLADERAGAVRICQLVEGMPLAIEMAASWTKSLRCATIAAEIQKNLDFLRSSSRNMPSRHQNMRAVFTQTWERLSDPERTLFQRLAVFRGDFSREAAEQVAGATLATLTSLVDKCLVRPQRHERFTLHELLRQFVEDRLSTDQRRQARDAHGAYYADFLCQRSRMINGQDQQVASGEIKQELENVRAAWRWAVQQCVIDALEQSAATFFYFCQLRSRYLEGAQKLEAAVDCLKADHPSERAERLRAQVMVYLSWLLIRIGRLQQAEAVLIEARQLFEARNIQPAFGMGSDPLSPLTTLKVTVGAYREAVSLGEELLRNSIDRDDKHNQSFACYGLANAHLNLGEYDTASRYAQRAVALSKELGNRWFMTYCMNVGGNIAHTQGRFEEAARLYRASYHIRQEFDDPEGMAVALNHLGEVALAQGRYAAASEHYAQSLAIYQDLNDQGGLARVELGLGCVACEQADYASAAQHLRQALQIAQDIQFLPLTLSIVSQAGVLFLRSGRFNRTGELLRGVLEHPASSRAQKQRVEALLADERLAWDDAASLPDFDATVAALAAELLDVSLDSAGGNAQADRQPLIEPLTGRELEVLRLMAQGFTNSQIAGELVIALGTVKWYASQIYGKLGVSNRTEAAARARDLGILASH